MSDATPQRPRILIAGFQHETNTLNPSPTRYDDFVDGGGWMPMTQGAALIDAFRPLNIALGGFVRAAEVEVDLIPVLWTSAEPSGVVTAEAFDRITALICDAAKEAGALDGVYLDLHGAMVTERFSDGEAEIAQRVRDAIGPETPLAISLDLHANVSAAFVGIADAVTIYRTYPHLDMDETGARAWAMLRAMIETGERPEKAFRQSTTRLPLSAQCTEFGPIGALYDLLPETTGACSADIALGFPPARIADSFPSVVAYGTGSAARADALVRALNEAATAADNTLLSPEAAVARATALTEDGGTVILADVQDNSGAGATSATGWLLRALIDGGAEDAALGILCDPDAAAAAHRMGVGGKVTMRLRGANGAPEPSLGDLTMEVAALSSGRFTCTGEMQRDVVTDFGPSALLRHGGVDVVVSSARHQCIDQAAFTHIGMEPQAKRIVAVKSTVHFRADFAPWAKAVINVKAPGLAVCDINELTFDWTPDD
ncbi:MAG: M81 family metallopeptidase [Pseudomonadota bacterium]